MTRPTLLHGAKVITPDAVLDEGAVLLDGDRIVAVLSADSRAAFEAADLGPATRAMLDGAERVDLRGGYLIPGLIDLHVHGAATASYDDGPEAIAAAVAAHRRHGTTRTLLSLITAAEENMTASIRGAVTAAELDSRIAGIHLEGPFLADGKRGAHDATKLLAPDLSLLDRFLDAGDGRIRMVTLAPELPGGLEMVRALVAAEVHAAVGHCEADYAQASAAFEAGADVVTHAFNAMRPLHHREPGVIAAARDAGVVMEAINDGVHLHDATVRLLNAIAGGNLAFVTDAMSAADAADGHYVLGSLDVDVVHGVARLSNGGSIAGSTLTMDRALGRAVVELGMDICEAVNAATRVPARVLAIADDVGSIEPGKAADFVVFDDNFTMRALMLGGEWGDERRP